MRGIGVHVCPECGEVFGTVGGLLEHQEGCKSRDDRVEHWYQQSAREMAEEIVDLEDEIAELKHRIEGLEK